VRIIKWLKKVQLVVIRSSYSNQMVIILIGVSGSGKTSIGRALSLLTGYAFLDADDYHSPENIAKMSRGEPLNDADRLLWLDTLSEVISSQIDRGEQTILACSALKKSYRSQLAQSNLPSIHFVYLDVAPELLETRLKQRKGHFMSPKLLLSQLETLEEPTADEATIVRVQTETSPETIAIYIHNKLEHL
jgi:gluconokinase